MPGQLVSAASLSRTIIVDSVAPIAASTPPSVTTAGGTTYTFTVTYTDSTGINPSSLHGGDILVTGPNAYQSLAAFVASTISGNTLTATYSVHPPGGAWSSSGNGTYTVALQPNEVGDIAGNYSAGGALGTFTVNIGAGATSVNLTSSFNRTGIVNDGASFSGTGIDGDGYAYSASQIGSSVVWNGNTYSLGPVGANNAIAAAGQTVTLPQRTYSTLSFIGIGVNGSQVSQSFVVHYSDGTSQTFTQSLSDWFTAPQNYLGESTVLTVNHRDFSNGTTQSGTGYLHGYSFALTAGKTLVSITLPNNANVVVMAIDLA